MIFPYVYVPGLGAIYLATLCVILLSPTNHEKNTAEQTRKFN